MKMSRRTMMKNGMLMVSSGMVMPSLFSRAIASAQVLAKDGAHFAQAANDHTLIVVQMAGGNDGLNTIVPYNDPLYKKLRPTLAIAEDKVLQLDTRLGLHPNLQPLKGIWNSGNMAVIEGVGYPNQSLSHFEAMDIWQTL